MSKIGSLDIYSHVIETLFSRTPRNDLMRLLVTISLTIAETEMGSK